MSSVDVTIANGHSSRPVAQTDLDAVNQNLLALARLVETADEGNSFFSSFLRQAIELTHGSGAAVWSHGGQQGSRLLAELNLEKTGLQERTPAWTNHALVVEDAAQRNQSLWVSPQQPGLDAAVPVGRANLTPFSLLLAPVIIDKQVVGVLEIFQEPGRSRDEKRRLAQLATQLAGFVAAFLHKTQHRALIGQRRMWDRLEAFSLRIHNTLDPEEVAYVAVNEGKKLFDCDQVALGVRRRRDCRIEAVSGAVRVDRRGPLALAMQALLRAVADWGQSLLYDGQRNDDWPPAVAQALDAYLTQSKASRLVAHPLRGEIHGAEEIHGVLLAECFSPSEAALQLKERLELLGRHVAPALGNALRYEQLPLQWLTRPLARLQAGLPSASRYKLLAAAALLMILVGVLTLVRVPLRLEANGELAPQERRIVFAPLNGKILQLLVQHGDRVEKGQELLFLEDPETQLKLNKLNVAIGAAKQKLFFLDEHLPKVPSPKDRVEILSERIKTQYELQKATVERDLILAECRNPQKAPVLAPLAGQLLTFDAREKLLGKEVKVGDPLLRVAATEGTWEVELLLPEREVGTIRMALANAGELTVDLLVSSDPQRTYAGKLSPHDLSGETIVQNNKVVLPVRVQITDRALLTQLEQMPVGVEVRAKVNCGHATLGYVWLGELWNFVYERFLF